MLTDLLLAAWLTGVAALLTLVAAPRVFALRHPDRVVRTVDGIGLLTLLTVLAVSALAGARLVNGFTMALVCLAAPVIRYLHACDWALDRAVRETSRRIAIRSARLIESGTLANRFGDAIRARRDALRQASRTAGNVEASVPALLVVAIISAAATVTVYLRYAPALGDVRLGSPEAYAVLLQARQAMHNQPAALLTPVTAALAAALSLATSLNPLHVVRFLGPAIGVATVFAAALLAYRLTRSAAVAASVLWILGGCTFTPGASPSDVGPAWILDRTLARHWTANDGTTALLFLLLAGIGATGVSASARGTRAPLPRGSAACLLVVALASPALLALWGAAWMAAFVPHRFRYFTVGAATAAVSLLAARNGASDLAFTLPVATTFLVTASFVLAARYLGRVTRVDLKPASGPAAAAALVALTIALLPRTAGALYLEHEITAIKTLEIASDFPRGRWLIVAPLEQLAQTYGRGWFEDPATFVAKNGPRAGDPAFAFDMAVDDLFVFVERRPFKTFAYEAADVPFSTLADASYRQYRSLAGRASLQAQMHALCEAYTRTHSDASIYYDDDQIRIYRFRVAR